MCNKSVIRHVFEKYSVNDEKTLFVAVLEIKRKWISGRFLFTQIIRSHYLKKVERKVVNCGYQYDTAFSMLGL